MTFETWAKELLCKELKNQGTMIYVRKPRERQGWYCATPNGFLLHVEAEKIRFGDFRIKYEIMPLIGRIAEAVKGAPYVPSVSMGMNYDMALDYIGKFGYSYNHNSRLLRSKSIGEGATDEIVVDMIRNYLNPLFESLTSYENYCKAAIEIMLFHNKDIDVNKRKEIAQMLFDRRPDVGIDPPVYYRDNYPSDYPWFAQKINQMPYVYALLGKYEDALAKIRGIRHVRMKSLEYNYTIGTYTNRMDNSLSQKQKKENEDHEIETAMQEKDIVRIRNILEANYQRNRELIYERLGIEIPETCAGLT